VQCPFCEDQFSISQLASRVLLEAKTIMPPELVDAEDEPLNEHEIEIDHEEAIPISDVGSRLAADAPLELKTAPRRQRRSAGMGTLVGIVGGGAVGLFLGAYALLWLRGPEGDIAGLAKWLPPFLLPESAQDAADFDSTN
jgi:hypothetical protein